MIRATAAAERRVLSVIRWPLGGIRTYLLYNYPRLMAAGYRFTLLGPADDAFRRLCREVRDWQGVEFVEAPLCGAKCRLRATVRGLLRQGRHGLIHSQGLTAGVQAVLANLGRGVPHVVTSHDVFRPDQFAGWKGSCKRGALAWLAYRADALVTVSHDAERNHRQYLGDPPRTCRIVTIPNGIETARFQAPPAAGPGELRARLGLGADACLLGFLGRFMEQKGFLVLVDALEQALALPGGQRLHLVAVGSDDYLREYRAAIDARPGLAGRIAFLEHTPDVLPVLRQLDLMVMPSLWEACPLLPMEALCAGVPVLGSDCIGLREVLAGTPAVMTPAGDSRALAAALGQALASPWTERAAAYAPAARRRFDVGAAADQLTALFDEVRSR